jgi:putative glycosyl hydrolase
MRRLARLALISLVLAASIAAPAQATAPDDGYGHAIADDSAFNTGNPGPVWGQWFDRLRVKAFRLQLHWNANSTDITKAQQLIDYVRARGVTSVLVTFKKNGAMPTPQQYANGISPVVAALASRVDVWGPANEPNGGDKFFPDGSGADVLGQVWKSFKFVVKYYDPTALLTSPDFVDNYNRSPIDQQYIFRYIAYGGEWGDIVAFHPYWGVHFETTSTTLDIMQYTTNTPVWITEVGAFGKNTHSGHPLIDDSPSIQYGKVYWLDNTLATLSRVKRVYYYQMNGQDDFDTGLLNFTDHSPRPAWNLWCIATHGNQAVPECDYVHNP